MESRTLEPLASEEGTSSDHRIAYCRLDLPRITSFQWETYAYRHYNEESKALFKQWMVLHGWEEVLGVSGSNRKTETYQATLLAAIDNFFPLKTIRRRSNDLPWMSKKVLKEIKSRKRLFGRKEESAPQPGRKQRRRLTALLRKENEVTLTRKKATFYPTMPIVTSLGTSNSSVWRSGLSTWKYQFSYDH